jgi:hypothetical protein
MTENEAKTKRCCGPSGCGKSMAHYASERFCIGSDCMSFRSNPEWIELSKGAVHQNPSWRKKDESEQPKHMSNSNIWTHENVYCGLAGKP